MPDSGECHGGAYPGRRRPCQAGAQTGYSRSHGWAVPMRRAVQPGPRSYIPARCPARAMASLPEFTGHIAGTVSPVYGQAIDHRRGFRPAIAASCAQLCASCTKWRSHQSREFRPRILRRKFGLRETSGEDSSSGEKGRHHVVAWKESSGLSSGIPARWATPRRVSPAAGAVLKGVDVREVARGRVAKLTLMDLSGGEPFRCSWRCCCGL
jgi:hypothetical protein